MVVKIYYIEHYLHPTYLHLKQYITLWFYGTITLTYLTSLRIFMGGSFQIRDVIDCGCMV